MYNDETFMTIMNFYIIMCMFVYPGWNGLHTTKNLDFLVLGLKYIFKRLIYYLIRNS